MVSGGSDWRAYFRERRLAAEEARRAEPAIKKEVPVLLLPAENQEPSAVPGAPGALLKRLLSRGYEARVSRALTRVPAARRIKATEEHAAGAILHPPHCMETFCLIASWRGEEVEQRVGIDATWERKHPDTAPPLKHKPGSMSFRIATTYDPYLGYEIRTTASKPRKQNAVEAELGADPPMGFTEWINLICPSK